MQAEYSEWMSVKDEVESELKQLKTESEKRREQLKSERARFGIEIGHLRREVENSQIDLTRTRNGVEETQHREAHLSEQILRLETMAHEKEAEINDLFPVLQTTKLHQC